PRQLHGVDAVAGAEVLDLGAHVLDDAGALGAEDVGERRLPAEHPGKPALLLVHVPLGDPGVGDADEDVARAGLRDGERLHLEDLGAAEAIDRDGAHDLRCARHDLPPGFAPPLRPHLAYHGRLPVALRVVVRTWRTRARRAG